MKINFWKIYDALVLHFPILPALFVILFFVLTACGKPEVPSFPDTVSQPKLWIIQNSNGTCPAGAHFDNAAPRGYCVQD